MVYPKFKCDVAMDDIWYLIWSLSKKQPETLINLVIYVLIITMMYPISSFPVVCKFWLWLAIYFKGWLWSYLSVCLRFNVLFFPLVLAFAFCIRHTVFIINSIFMQLLYLIEHLSWTGFLLMDQLRRLLYMITTIDKISMP